jgi:hypothetical protein
MIFILLEQHFNGTVTMAVVPTGIKAASFRKAVNKIKEKLKPIHGVKITCDDDEEFRYSIGNELVGRVKKSPLNIL